VDVFFENITHFHDCACIDMPKYTPSWIDMMVAKNDEFVLNLKGGVFHPLRFTFH